MGLREFKGKLRSVPPESLIKKDHAGKIDDFFLVLGTIYNDLKGLILFEILIQELYRKPEKNEISVHSGEYGGVLIQINKMVAGVVNEFFKFLEANKDVLLSPEFKIIINKISKERQKYWEEIELIALNHYNKNSEFTKILSMIRNNIAFHYYQSGKTLREGYIKFFYENELSENNKSAYFSVNDNMEGTRFYYCDAAVQQYLYSQAEKLDPNSESIEIYQKNIIITTRIMHETIKTLMKAHIKNNPFI